MFYMFFFLDEVIYRVDILYFQDEVNFLKVNLSVVWEKFYEYDEFFYVIIVVFYIGFIRIVYRNIRRFWVKFNFFMDILDYLGDDGSVVVQGIQKNYYFLLYFYNEYWGLQYIKENEENFKILQINMCEYKS